jgi:hypothetical protein
VRRSPVGAAHRVTMTTSARTIVDGLEPMLTIEELSEYLAVLVRTPYDWRQSGRGPRAVHVGRGARGPKWTVGTLNVIWRDPDRPGAGDELCRLRNRP